MRYYAPWWLGLILYTFVGLMLLIVLGWPFLITNTWPIWFLEVPWFFGCLYVFNRYRRWRARR